LSKKISTYRQLIHLQEKMVHFFVLFNAFRQGKTVNYFVHAPLVPRPVNGCWIGEACFFFIKARGGRNAGHFDRRATQRKGKQGQ
jgi:hypothetical protein